MDTFTLSSSGTYAQEPAAVFNGIVTGITNLQLNPTATRVPYTVSKADNCDAGFPIAVTVRGNTGVQGILTARVWLTPSALRTEATPDTHYHVLNPIAHDVNQLTVAATTPGTTSAAGGFVYNAAARLTIRQIGSAAGLYQLYESHSGDDGWLWAVGGYDKDMPVSGLTLSVDNTTHTHGVPALTVTGSTTQTSGGTGGATKAVTDPNILDPKAGMHHAMFPNSLVPTGLTLWVDGVQVAGPVNGPLTVDLYAYFAANPHGDHTVEGRCATIGHLDLEVVVERYQSSIATGR
jgi:hypothetical protein